MLHIHFLCQSVGTERCCAEHSPFPPTVAREQNEGTGERRSHGQIAHSSLFPVPSPLR